MPACVFTESGTAPDIKTGSGSRLYTRGLAFIPFFGSDYLQMTERSGPD